MGVGVVVLWLWEVGGGFVGVGGVRWCFVGVGGGCFVGVGGVRWWFLWLSGGALLLFCGCGWCEVVVLWVWEVVVLWVWGGALCLFCSCGWWWKTFVFVVVAWCIVLF